MRKFRVTDLMKKLVYPKTSCDFFIFIFLIKYLLNRMNYFL